MLEIANIVKVNKVNEQYESNTVTSYPEAIEITQQLEAIHYINVLNSSRKNTFKLLQSQIIIIVLLLILSNDVHLNPGPPTKSPEDYCGIPLQCSSCKKWTEINEEIMNNIKECSFEWICPTLTCTPNHQIISINYHTSPCTSPNHYTLLNTQKREDFDNPRSTANSRNKSTVSKPAVKKKIKKAALKSEDKNLLVELPYFNTEDFEWQDPCRRCFKKVLNHHRAILCDKCDRWIHLKCSDMSESKYKKNKCKKTFKWKCNLCRDPEEAPTNLKFDARRCKKDELPESWDTLRKQIKKDEDIIIHLNARSAVEKGDDINEICNKLKPALILLTESWFDDSCPKGTAVPKGYKIIRKDRSDEYKYIYGKTNGGGVAVLVREDLDVRKHNTLNKDQNEILWVTLKMNGIRHLIGTIYRAEYTNLLKTDDKGNSEFENLLQDTQDYNLILMGDTNCDTKTLNPSKSTRTLIKTAEEHGLQQVIDKPTRFNESTSTTIDHIFIRNNDFISKTGTCEGISDHCGIYCFIKKENESNEAESIRCRSFKNFDEDLFREDIKSRVDESEFYHHIRNKEINLAFDIWLEIIKNVADEHAPWKEFKRKGQNKFIPWYTKELEDIAKRKNMYLKLYRLYRNPEDLNLYKTAKNSQTHLKRALKRRYYKEKIENFDGDSKKIWSILKEITNLDYREDILPDNVSEETANKFNKFFAKVGIEVQRKLGVQINLPNLEQPGEFKFENETEERIDYLIRRIKPDVATGYDEISPRLLKAAAPAILSNLKDLINLSYETNTFPEALKKANVKALHKKGEYNNPAQYRPISILSTISKIFGRSAAEQLMKYYTMKKKLNTKQHAYQKNHSTTTCLYELVESAKQHIDQGYLVAIASLDLSKAFDSLSHNLILQKLLNMGLDGTAVHWVKSYLENRKQVVKFGRIKSDEETVESGVPQGSILGPLLFITCTDDIEDAMQDYQIFSYADDMQILVKGTSIKEIERKLEEAIKKANDYYNRNSLLNNATKTEIMLLGTTRRLNKAGKLKVKVVNEENETEYIHGKEYLKILGVLVDQTLSWDKHISQIKQKATNTIRNVHRANKLLPMKQKRILYNSLVTPHFSYCDIIWNKCGRANTNKLQQAQNFAAKSILGVSKFSSSNEALKKLEMLPLEEKRNIHTAVHVKKIIEGNAPEAIKLRYSNLKRPAGLRPGNLQLPRHKTKQYEDGPLYSSLKIWNATPQHIRDTELNQFKDNLQKYKLRTYLET